MKGEEAAGRRGREGECAVEVKLFFYAHSLITNNLPKNGFIPVSFMAAMVLFVLDVEAVALLVANGSGAVCRPKLAVLIFA